MSQTITVTTDASVDLKPLLESAIRTELRMLELGLERTNQRLRDFEKRYGRSSEEFEHLYEARQIEESLDFIEWLGEIRTFRSLETQREALQGARLN